MPQRLSGSRAESLADGCGFRLLAARRLAGANRMPWRRFLLWNALGGIAWAASTVAYLVGRSASGSLGAIGFLGVAVAIVVYVVTRLRRRHPPRTG
jgi:membrane protein DedA with SNARE-associated domain